MKIVFLTFHNWQTKRQGGFHKFAEYAVKNNHEVIFFSFARGYYTYFKKDERLNKKVLKSLSKGVKYNVDDKTILNITLPTMSLPGIIRKLVAPGLTIFFETLSIKSKKKFFLKYFSDTDVFVFESNESILLFNYLKKIFPKTIYIYRPSDPLIANAKSQLAKKEVELLPKFDKVILVNKEGMELYKNYIPNFDDAVKYKIISNGVDVNDYKLKHNCPRELLVNNGTIKAVYVGARDPEWTLLVEASKQLPEICFYIVTPNRPPNFFLKAVEKLSNLIYIAGIPPKEVPAWVTNADIIIVPNPTGRYLEKPWGITAKYYQAMAAKKPIVAYHDNPSLKKLSVVVTYNVHDFISAIKQESSLNYKDYSIDINTVSWERVCRDFLENI